jgi:aldose 1-epimerase
VNRIEPEAAVNRTISIESAAQRLTVAPELGGAIIAWNWRASDEELPLLRPWDGESGDRYSLACFPLLPWANRISGGGFEHESVFYPLHANRSEEHYPIHGDGWLQAWQPAEQGSDRIKLTLESHGFDDNPYHYRATQTLLLLPDGLQIELAVTHLGQRNLPYGLGLRPYFIRHPNTLLTAKADGVWLSGSDPIPVEHSTRVPAGWGYNTAAPLNGDMIDNCFTGWDGKAVIDYPEHGLAITMSMADCNGYSLLYRPPGRDFFCFEPITHAVDAFHLPGQPGLAYLSHGDSLALRTRLLVGPSTVGRD